MNGKDGNHFGFCSFFQLLFLLHEHHLFFRGVNLGGRERDLDPHAKGAASDTALKGPLFHDDVGDVGRDSIQNSIQELFA